jgi:hypothetical protein
MSSGTSWLEWIVVALLVAGSVLFAVWRLIPTAWRVRLQVWLGWRVRNGDCGCAACPGTAPRDSGGSAQ